MTRPQKGWDKGWRRHEGETPQKHLNVGGGERAASVAAGSILAILGIARRSLSGFLIAGVGGAMIYRGATRCCAVYRKLGLDTAHEEDEAAISKRGIHVEQAAGRATGSETSAALRSRIDP